MVFFIMALVSSSTTWMVADGKSNIDHLDKLVELRFATNPNKTKFSFNFRAKFGAKIDLSQPRIILLLLPPFGPTNRTMRISCQATEG